VHATAQAAGLALVECRLKSGAGFRFEQAQCQIHSKIMANGVMKMRTVEGGLEIVPGATVAL
jgi:copper(I)-binding protein